jgi:hypothetical protein
MAKGIDFSTDCLHTTHFFMTAEQAMSKTSNRYKIAMIVLLQGLVKWFQSTYLNRRPYEDRA